MSNQKRSGNPISNFFATGIRKFDSLAELALDLRWSWNHCTDEIWKQLDPVLWDLTRNPWVVLQTVSRDQLEKVIADPDFRRMIRDLMQTKRSLAEKPAWFQRSHPRAALTCVAYFSMEFMLSEALPIYSGGLGNVAGDQLKAASDLGVPVVGVGLLYQQGYFRQMIDRNGAQESLFPYNDPGQLPIEPLREPNGEWLRLEVALPGYSVWLRAWQVQVGRIRLYLLDSNDAANFPAHRGITSELYGGGPELRLKQELLLGIGGWRLLRALGIRPEVCHLNEGHAAFAVLERTRSLMEETGLSFESALAVTRAGNLFTTHTAVPAGFDRFAPSLIEQYFATYAQEKLGITLKSLMALGRQDPDNASEDFNMAYLAIRGCGAVNGVSRLHGQVSRSIFQPLFPRWPASEVPVGHVTNGIHMPSWDSEEADDLWTEACGKERWHGETECLGESIRRVSEDRLWKLRTDARKSLVEYARKRLAQQLIASGSSAGEVEEASHLFDPDALTLGFARRFATYKRPNLLLQDPERLSRLLTNPQRPVQLIIAGKAHPADNSGRALIRAWIEFIRRPDIRPHVMFLSDYDMILTEYLVRGVDVWINTPRRPWEACGTSGMKVLVNGGINLSELDGWWAEAYSPEVGWAIGDGQEHGDDPAWDVAEAQSLYDLLEQQVIPGFYERGDNNIPSSWVARMRESMARLAPRFSANRTVREYTETYYLQAAADYRARSGNHGAIGKQLAGWIRSLEQNWNGMRFGEVRIKTESGHYTFEVEICLNDLDPSAIQVELYADATGTKEPGRQVMEPTGQALDSPGIHIYRAQVPCTRPASDFTPRVIPHFPGASIPLEASFILWER
jgi:starch phosphorylase